MVIETQRKQVACKAYRESVSRQDLWTEIQTTAPSSLPVLLEYLLKTTLETALKDHVRHET